MVTIPISRIEILCLATLVETAQLLDKSLSGEAQQTFRAQLETLVRVTGAAAVAHKPGSPEAPMQLDAGDVAILRDLRLVFTTLATPLRAAAGKNLRELAQILSDILDRAEVALALAQQASARMADGIPGAPEHG